MRLKDKIAIVTGAGAGIGEATAIRFAEEGARVLLADLNFASAAEVAVRIENAGGYAVPIACDISLEDDARRVTKTALSQFGGLDILVNNAADFTTFPVEEATVEQWDRVLSVNVVGTALMSKHAIPALKARGGGAIVNVGSVSGSLAQRRMATYNTSKAAINNMTRCMALDLAPFNIRVNTVSPGCILTSASEREWRKLGVSKEQWIAEREPLHMLNRLGDPRELANAILFMASDEASFVTAASLMVDGGYTAQ